jgi:hypothetical protein
MADTNERVMAMVQEELGRNPNASVTELQEKAQKIDPSMGDLTTRQFHARYPLQVKRAKAMKEGAAGGGRKATAKKKKKSTAKRGPAKRRGRPPKSAAKSTAARGAKAKKAAPAAAPARSRRGKGGESVKDVLVDFASQIAAAETATSLVKVMGGLDSWAERIDRASS